MAHDHDHHHTPHISSHNERKVLLSFWLIFIFMFVEITAGVLSGSLALIADAGHMFTDAIALALAYFGFRLGRKPPDSHRTFGYLRLEVLAAFINALLMMLIVLWIVYEAWQRFSNPPEIMAIPMFLAALLGLIVNIVVFWILTRGDTEHVNIRGAILHVLGDLLGSIGACGAAIIIYFSAWTTIDLLLSLLVACMILPSAWRLLKESTHILLEGAPPHASPEKVATHLRTKIPELADISHIHIWMVSSNCIMAIVHIRPEKMEDAERLTHIVEHELEHHFQITHATIAIDWQVSSPCPLLHSLDATHDHHSH